MLSVGKLVFRNGYVAAKEFVIDLVVLQPLTLDQLRLLLANESCDQEVYWGVVEERSGETVLIESSA